MAAFKFLGQIECVVDGETAQEDRFGFSRGYRKLEAI
jgi:hypothetical protein